MNKRIAIQKRESKIGKLAQKWVIDNNLDEAFDTAAFLNLITLLLEAKAEGAEEQHKSLEAVGGYYKHGIEAAAKVRTNYMSMENKTLISGGLDSDEECIWRKAQEFMSKAILNKI